MKAAAPPDAAAKPPSKKMAMIGAIVAVLALGGGGAGWYFTQSKGGEEAEETTKPSKKKKKAKAHAPPVFAPLEVFTVNLQPDGEEENMLQTTITLEMLGQEQADLIKANMPKVRSRVLLLLSAKKASDVKTVEGKNKLAEEILEALKKPFAENDEPQEVNEVMFTQFIIQSQ
ncbi:flagellar basal body-associated protein FliL [Massilia pseudoviolaceinigra]|uniref:flagellar basal body-associated protein FliL n=1 Tax=Massilia pseudoviolaceinigra TaxID=3057165 RepID=UPI00279682F3|nr:flagellar basal body-associated protein FliL [Massilia sp. CCM 9206]MDQ1925027.1 flagellar basal body-associated protein FliL [Massilia sp. CCM 9206]